MTHPLRRARPLFLAAAVVAAAARACDARAVGRLQIIWATTFGWLIFDQHPDRLSAVGMAIVVASGVSLAAWERRRSRLL